MKKQSAFNSALQILADHREGLHPEQFYKFMWPEAWAKGETVGGRSLSRGNTNGGPSRSECASNWLLGRVARKWPGSVLRYCPFDSNRAWAGKWVILPPGREVLRANTQ